MWIISIGMANPVPPKSVVKKISSKSKFMEEELTNSSHSFCFQIHAIASPSIAKTDFLP